MAETNNKITVMMEIVMNPERNLASFKLKIGQAPGSSGVVSFLRMRRIMPNGINNKPMTKNMGTII